MRASLPLAQSAVNPHCATTSCLNTYWQSPTAPPIMRPASAGRIGRISPACGTTSASTGRVSHSTAGALLACERFGSAGRVLAYLIASHHAGLYDWHSDTGSLEARLASEASRIELAEALAAAPPEILDHGGFAPNLRAIPGGPAGFALWLRMLFSALVDADFLDTEAFMDEGRAAARGAWPEFGALRADFDAHMDKLAATAISTSPFSRRSPVSIPSARALTDLIV